MQLAKIFLPTNLNVSPKKINFSIWWVGVYWFSHNKEFIKKN